MELNWLLIIVIAAIAVPIWFLRDKIRARPVPDGLRPGNPLPDFTAIGEDGNSISSSALLGSAAVLLFVRGTWCPFCSKQVTRLTKYYKDINESGARLILITPSPLETTRRVADFFEVEFEFWLDESLGIAKRLGLTLESGVPDDYHEEYGKDTVWPASLVVDANGIIRHTELSRFVADRPSPQKLLAVVKRL